MVLTQSIPVLNLRDFHASGDRHTNFIIQLGQALEKTGFFAITHHGVDSTLIQEAYQAAEQFFQLPESVKQTYEHRGFTSFGREHAKDHPYPDLKEFWHVHRDLPPGSPLAGSCAANVDITEVPQFRPVMIQLFAQLETCATELLKACALYLGEPETLLSDMTRNGDSKLRVLHYPPVPPDAHPASLRSAPHEDINFITLLCEATDDGLELLQRDGSWLPIPAMPGQIIVDSGDMLQQLTNGVLKSTTHRVMNPTGDHSRRFSMPFFVHPRKEIDLTPLPGCIAKVGKQQFPAITAGEYLMQRLREIGLAE
jgi:isopenicillin N synthase-like dioxygenase